MSEIPQTDVSRPSALPTANLLLHRAASQQQQNLIEQSSDQYLDYIEEEWNKKVDSEVEVLVDGMVDLVNLASIKNKDKFTVAQEAFQTQSRAESMVRAAHSLLSIVHSMKLLLLLSDESQNAHKRDAELKQVQEDKEETKKKVAALLDELLIPATYHGETNNSNNSAT
ncbi:hypothetical protein FA15DRAFT_585580 [Coprinopsis marcescibilis]|uniref:Mediator of RNA polymerase II transcription subunit 22 n=1 Tax=Coprinopsis marcescibilis TaxID=230819 RepID=A0A5C3L6J4_COPMA|nr:hypothetical protein FA15DRAFT_585580 [Coprinopsis marcescibilis]